MNLGDCKDMDETELFFFGEYTHSLDSQRRVAVPREWRGKDEDTRFILFPGRDSLMLIPFAAFRDFLVKARKVSLANRQAQEALARIGSKVQECVCDKQGRITISQRLLDVLSIKDELVMVGAFSSIQLWHPEAWAKRRDNDDSYLDEVQRITESPDGLMDLLKEMKKD